MRLAILPVLLLAALSSGCRFDFLFGEDDWEWRSLGRVPAGKSMLVANHTPVVVSGEVVLLGTGDGIWRRRLDGTDGWRRAGLAGVAVHALRRHAHTAATLYAAGAPLAAPDAAPFYRSDDGGDTWLAADVWPRSLFDGTTFAFFDLALAPDDDQRLYANLSGASIAVSADGGLTWRLANDATDVDFNVYCTLHILPDDPDTLYQGCEAPLDVAWIATYALAAAAPFTLADFTFVAGAFQPGLEDLQNRRPNALASGPARPATLYAGVEGGLLALTGTDVEWVFRSQGNVTDLPYAYIKGIWLDPADGDHILFGGGVNGPDTQLALFETRSHGRRIAFLPPPDGLGLDPEVEQIVALDAASWLVLISENPTGDTVAPRALRLFVLTRK